MFASNKTDKISVNKMKYFSCSRHESHKFIEKRLKESHYLQFVISYQVYNSKVLGLPPEFNLDMIQNQLLRVSELALVQHSSSALLIVHTSLSSWLD